MPPARRDPARPLTVAHLTTVDLSLRFLLLAQLRAVRDLGGTAIGVSAPGPWVAELEAEGIRHVPLHSSTRANDPLADLRAARELARVLRRERVDVLHTHNPKPGLYGRVVGRLLRVPVVVNTVHGLYATDDDPLPKRALVYSLEAVASRFSDAELVQNPEDLALMRRLHLTRHAKLLGNGVDLARFDESRFSPDDRRALRATFGASDETVVIGTVGRLVAEKGIPELIEAFSRLPHRDRYRLVVAGGADPDKPDALDPALVEQAAADGVQFLGQRSDIDALYAAMDVFVLASHREGFPRAAMEAAATGRPVIATDVRGCRQVVDDGRNGLLVPVHDPAALAGAMAALGTDPQRRAAMGTESRVVARERFDERRVVEIVLDTYARVAARKGISLPGLAPPGPAPPGPAP
jgi:glycosyltransferase involved in cell wall biosynthesis